MVRRPSCLVFWPRFIRGAEPVRDSDTMTSEASDTDFAGQQCSVLLGLIAAELLARWCFATAANPRLLFR